MSKIRLSGYKLKVEPYESAESIIESSKNNRTGIRSIGSIENFKLRAKKYHLYDEYYLYSGETFFLDEDMKYIRTTGYDLSRTISILESKMDELENVSNIIRKYLK